MIQMHSHCIQSFGTNTAGAKEKKQCGISETVSWNIWVFLSGHAPEDIKDYHQRESRNLCRPIGQIEKICCFFL